MNTDAAYVELAEAKKAVRASRRAFARGPDSKFVAAMKTAMDTYRTDRKGGLSRDEAIAALEVTLRQVWPNKPSKFGPTCQNCDDTGTVEHFCWSQQRCGRKNCAEHAERQHAYVSACHCDKGRRFQPRQRSAEDAIAAAGRTQKKSRGFSRVGV